MEITYTEQNGYLLPDLMLPKEETTYGHFGRMRKAYLKGHRRSFYNALLLSGKLESHLAEVNTKANEMLKLLISQMTQSQGIPEEPKAQDQMAWIGAIRQIFAYAEEKTLRVVVYS